MNKQLKKYNTFFLDRDGVINENRFVNTPDDFIFLAQSLDAIRLLRDMRKTTFIITNQGGIEAGYLTEEKLEEIHSKMIGEILKTGGFIKDIYYCPHLNTECECRKPKPGMIIKALETYKIKHNECCFIGDHITDWQAAIAAGIDPIAIQSSRHWEQEAYELMKIHNIPLHRNLHEAISTHA